MIRLLLHAVVGMFSRHLLPVVSRIFVCCFGMSCFVCTVLPFLDISLIFHLLPVLSRLFPQCALLFFLVLPFRPHIFQRIPFVLFFWPFLVEFLSAFSCCLKTSTFLPDLYHFFLYPLYVGLLLNYQCCASCLTSLVHVLRLCIWFLWFLKSSFVYLKKEQPTFAGLPSLFLCSLLGEHLSVMTPKPVAWVPRCVIFWFNILSWVVYCGYTSHRGCLLSASLAQMWTRTDTVTVLEQQVIQKFLS